MKLELTPISLREARAFVDRVHRHHSAPQGGKFAVAVSWEGSVVGVAIASRPVSRFLDDGWTLEVSRVATDGTRNACSMLYGAVRRAGKAMGYKRFVTYTLETESGASLRASGWTAVDKTESDRSWSRPGRPRVDAHPLQTKIRFEAE